MARKDARTGERASKLKTEGVTDTRIRLTEDETILVRRAAAKRAITTPVFMREAILKEARRYEDITA